MRGTGKAQAIVDAVRDALQPCPTCPWRKSSTVGGRDIPGFSIELMRRLRGTCAAPGEGDGLRRIMVCHYSKEGKERACRGYVAIENFRNINLRMLARTGEVDIKGTMAACAELDLWRSFDEMLEAYEAAHQGDGHDDTKR